jgi:hypothetical protein
MRLRFFAGGALAAGLILTVKKWLPFLPSEVSTFRTNENLLIYFSAYSIRQWMTALKLP